MKNPLQKKHAKYALWSVVVGGHALIIKVLGDVVVQRNTERQRANTMSAMFGSLADYIGEDTYNAWEAHMSEMYPIEKRPADWDENSMSADAMDEENSIVTAMPIDEVDHEDGGETLDVTSTEVSTDGGESSSEIEEAEEVSDQVEHQERNEPAEPQD